MPAHFHTCALCKHFTLQYPQGLPTIQTFPPISTRLGHCPFRHPSNKWNLIKVLPRISNSKELFVGPGEGTKASKVTGVNHYLTPWTRTGPWYQHPGMQLACSCHVSLPLTPMLISGVFKEGFWRGFSLLRHAGALLKSDRNSISSSGEVQEEICRSHLILFSKHSSPYAIRTWVFDLANFRTRVSVRGAFSRQWPIKDSSHPGLTQNQ